MISNSDIQRLIHRPATSRRILSVFLDMAVNADNKRTYNVFLQQRRGQYADLDSDREGHHREAVGEAFERVQQWIGSEFEEANKGIAIYTEVGGDWLEGLQFPVPVRNATYFEEAPVIKPLAEVVETYPRHGVVLVDRENLRMIDVFLGEPQHEHRVATEPFPAPHDLQRGGYSQKDNQKRKAEEVRHFWKEFVAEVGEFDRRYRLDDLILLGTEENVKNFLEFLPLPLREKVAHTDTENVNTSTADVLERLAPFFAEQVRRRQAETVDLLRDRVRNRHLATAGFRDTLEHLQEGKVDTLVLARASERRGARCLKCGFFLVRRDGDCPYCGGNIRDSVDLAEAMVRLAEEQDIQIAFVGAEALADLDGVGALLRF